jgi:uncharacterized coiled-coil DUF342 family protein
MQKAQQIKQEKYSINRKIIIYKYHKGKMNYILQSTYYVLGIIIRTVNQCGGGVLLVFPLHRKENEEDKQFCPR